MCGIAGMVNLRSAPGVLRLMMDALRHRGPDGEGQYTEPGIVELGHRRLAIIDLQTGDQPQISPDGRYVLIFNGELYNYLELRPELEARGWQFKTTSDTEVLLAGLVLHGVDFLKRTIGMFALAFWDKTERSLLLARDRVGVKPLYYALLPPNGLVFSSELKSILCVPGVSREVDPDALDAYLTLRYVPGPKTMVRNIFKFPCGHWAIFKDGKFRKERYWKVDFDSKHHSHINASEATARFETLLEDSVKLRLRSDVPFGLFLSSGVDSTTILAMMAKHSAQPVRTFSIGFTTGADEQADAARVARHFGADHSSFILRPDDLQRIPDVAWYMDEPFPDPIVLAMFLLAEKAHNKVKVVLTGEGADELLSGYVHHPHLRFLAKLAALVPPSAFKAAAGLARHIPMKALERYFNYPASPGIKGRERLPLLLRAASDFRQRYLAYASLMTAGERNSLYSRAYRREVISNHYVEHSLESIMTSSKKNDPLDDILNLEYQLWLPDNILFKQDKTLMAHGLEGRVPYCDHRLVEFGAQLPLSLKCRPGKNKAILRNVAERLFPPELLSRRKQAFMVPLSGAYGKVMQMMLNEMLSGRRFRERNLFDAQAVRRLMAEYDRSPFIVAKQLMALLMLEFWFERVLDGNGAQV